MRFRFGSVRVWFCSVQSDYIENLSPSLWLLAWLGLAQLWLSFVNFRSVLSSSLIIMTIMAFRSIDPDIDNCSKWEAERFGWGGMTESSIWTSNQSETCNKLFKHHLKFEEVQMNVAFGKFRDAQRMDALELARYDYN